MSSTLSVVLMGGSPVPMEISRCINVLQLRLCVAEALSVEAEQVQLLADGRELHSEETLDDLKDVDVVNAVLRAPEAAIFVADGGNHRISKWRPGKAFGEVVAGSGTAGPGLDQLSRPKGIFVDCEGALVIADSANNRIMKWRRGQSTGEVLVGEKAPAAAEEEGLRPLPRQPRGVFVDRAGALYVGDFLQHRVTCWPPGSVVAGSASEGSSPESHVRHPANIFITDDGVMYVAEFGNDRVTKWAPGASRGEVVAGGNGRGRELNQLDAPWGVAVDAKGALYVSETNNHRVTRWAPGCSHCEVVAGGRGSGADLSQLGGPTGICIDRDGKLYVAENHNHRVTCWTPGAERGEVVAGGNGLGNHTNQLDHPTDVYAY